MFTPEGASEAFAQLHAAAWLAGEAHKEATYDGDVAGAERAIDVADAIYSELYPAPLEPSSSDIVARISRYTNRDR